MNRRTSRHGAAGARPRCRLPARPVRAICAHLAVNGYAIHTMRAGKSRHAYQRRKSFRRSGESIMPPEFIGGGNGDIDATETKEWPDSLDGVLQTKGPERASFLLSQLRNKAHRQGVATPFTANTPYINTIPADNQPPYPGSREIERRIKSLVRWNAMAMVVRANVREHGIGGHISTYASSATLYEVALNHFLRGPEAAGGGDQVYFQGHASPGVYARAFLEGRLSAAQLENFRRELAPGGGLSSYPHP